MPGPSQQELLSRLQSLPPTFAAYAAPELQAYIKSIIPPSLLHNHPLPSNPYISSGPNPDEYFYGTLSRDDDYIQSLLRWFKRDFFKWTNRPRCPLCSKDPSVSAIPTGTTGPTTPEEVAGKATRVETYNCTNCATPHRFPRYNDPLTLLQPQNRRGRCGEFANAFAAILVAVGYETRYVLDLTDHVWCEYYSFTLDRWVHVDPCEAKVDGDGLYEHGWGKKLSYIFAVEVDGIAEVTPRYSRLLATKEMQARRAGCPQLLLDEMLHRINGNLKASLPPARLAELARRTAKEREYMLKSQTVPWGDERRITEGRVTGDINWRRVRGELAVPRPAPDAVSTALQLYAIPADPTPFLAAPDFGPITVNLTPTSYDFRTPAFNTHCIKLNGASVGLGLRGLNLAVLHPYNHTLLSVAAFHVFAPAPDADADAKRISQIHALNLSNFLTALPPDRIVLGACVGDSPHGCLPACQALLGTFLNIKEFQRAFATTCNANAVASGDDGGLVLELKSPEKSTCEGDVCRPNAGLVLSTRTFPNTYSSTPDSVLPFDIMSLEQQQNGSKEACKQAATMYITLNPHFVGFVHAPASPVYLLTAASFPLRSKEDAIYSTTLRLPEMFCLKEAPSSLSKPPQFAGAGLVSQLGRSLVCNSAPIVRPSVDALTGKKLLCLYFSAYWCGPCRAFTPKLSGLYEAIKEHVEVVFVSSDRSEADFNAYFGSMPWLALPFEAQAYRQTLSAKCGVRGIPCLAVMDPITGALVTSEGREDVANYGAEVVSIWMSMLAGSSLDKMDEIERSSGSSKDAWEKKERERVQASLKGVVRPPPLAEKEKKDMLAASVKARFGELMLEDKARNPNEAAAQAIRDARKMLAEPPATKWFSPRQQEKAGGSGWDVFRSANEAAKVAVCVETLIKYVGNAAKNSSSDKYKIIKVSNKVFCEKVMVCKGVVAFLTYLGFGGFEYDGGRESCVLRMCKDLDLDKVLEALREGQKTE